MKTIKKILDVKCSDKFIWDVLTTPSMFERWGSAFNKTATFKGKIALNETVIFLDGEGMGMETKISHFIPYKSLTYSFINEIGGSLPVEETIFKQQYERYTIDAFNEYTRLTVELYVIDEYFEGMDAMWNDAIVKIKMLCEMSSNNE